MRKVLDRLVKKHILNRSVLTSVDLLRAWVSWLVGPKDAIEQIAKRVKPLGAHRCAIMAVYQNQRFDPNLLMVADMLRKHGCDVLVVNNGRLTPEERAICESSFQLYHERASGTGRDFASYRVGFLALLAAMQAQSAEPEEILFLNDSVYYLQDRMDRFLGDFFCMRRDWKGVTESSSPSYHVSSWFFSVSKELWRDSRFQSYWRTYKPLHSRPYVIANGEVGLSTFINRLGKSSWVLYSASYFLRSIESVTDCRLAELLSLMPAHFGDLCLKAYGKYGAADQIEDVSSLVKAEILLFQQRTNQSAFWQLVGCLHAGFPFVKKDIYARGVYSMPQLRYFCDRASASMPYWDEIVAKLTAAPDHKTYRGMQRLRRDYGLD